MRKLFITYCQVQVFFGHCQRADSVRTSIFKNSSSSANDQKQYVRIPIPGIWMGNSAHADTQHNVHMQKIEKTINFKKWRQSNQQHMYKNENSACARIQTSSKYFSAFPTKRSETATAASLSKVRFPINKVQPGCLVTLLQSIMLDVSREPLNCGVQSLVSPIWTFMPTLLLPRCSISCCYCLWISDTSNSNTNN